MEKVREAGAKLNVNRDKINIVGYLRDNGLKFSKALTLECGVGRGERQLLKHNLQDSFHGIDISEKKINVAREISEKEKLAFTYEVADMNYIELPENEYDFVFAQTCLHHVLNLEHRINIDSHCKKEQRLLIESYRGL